MKGDFNAPSLGEKKKAKSPVVKRNSNKNILYIKVFYTEVHIF